MSKRSRLPFRSWFYFRMGFHTYLAFILSAINMMVVVYYLAIKSVPVLETIFPSFVIWALAVSAVGVPLSVFLGHLHVKRSGAFRSELDIQVEANPYYYKLPPGFWKEVFAPTYLELLRLNLKLLNKEPLTEEEQKHIKELQKRLENLIGGGYVGTHRTKDVDLEP
ncbi:MAG: hypothetical protein ACRD38_07820 [Nitrososphaerales archaeon]